MKAIDYWNLSITNSMVKKLAWALSAFTVTRPAEGWTVDQAIPLVIYYDAGTPSFVDLDGIVHAIEDVGKNKPVFKINDTFTLAPNIVANNKSKIQTTYGIAFLNALWLSHYAGDAIPYINGVMTPSDVMAKLVKAVLAEELTVSAAKQCVKAMYWSTGLTQIAVPSASVKSLVPSKDVLKLRDELLKRNKDKLDDPVVMADIENQLSEADKEYLKGDPAEIFYRKDKAYKITRKKMLIMKGSEEDLTEVNKHVLLSKPLSNGIDIDELPMQINTLRLGSYNRGSQTELGGEIVKFLMRVFQKTHISVDDCGTKLGWTFKVDAITVNALNSRYRTVNGKAVFIEDPKSLMGKTITLRSPSYCNAKDNNFCSICMGKAVSRSKNALPMLAVSEGSTFLDIFMASAHAKSLESAEYDFNLHIY